MEIKSLLQRIKVNIYEVIATWDDGVAGWDSGEISYTFVVDVR